MPLSAEDIRAALAALGGELLNEGARAEIVIVGGAALVLLFNARESTKDVDAFFVKPEASLLRAAAGRVAVRLALPTDWLNDGAKGYLVGLSKGDLVFESSSLIAHAASLEQLLAMKLAAWRDAIDRDDAKLLLEQFRVGREQVWATVKPFVPPHQLDKASYAFDDLWEALHGRP
jgi:hypothetical protein